MSSKHFENYNPILKKYRIDHDTSDYENLQHLAANEAKSWKPARKSEKFEEVVRIMTSIATGGFIPAFKTIQKTRSSKSGSNVSR